MQTLWQDLRYGALVFIKRPAVILLAVLTLTIGLGAAQIAPESPRRLPDGYGKARGAVTDAATGLPKRIIHKASGIVLALIPAGEFAMGSPPNEANRLRGEDQHRRVIRQPFPEEMPSRR